MYSTFKLTRRFQALKRHCKLHGQLS